MNEFVITEEHIYRIYLHGYNHKAWETCNEVKETLSRPLSAELQKERKRVLDKIIDKLMENPLCDSGVESMKSMGKIVESLRGEP